MGSRVVTLMEQLQELAAAFPPGHNVTVPIVMNDGGQLWTNTGDHVAMLGHMRYAMKVRANHNVMWKKMG